MFALLKSIEQKSSTVLASIFNSMKLNPKLVFLFLFLFVGFQSVAQKFAYVDSEYILSQIPKYKSAQLQLNELSAQWQQEVEKKFLEIDNLRKAFKVEKVLLTKDMQMAREKEINTKEDEAKKFQLEKFGSEGELFRKKSELIRPIQDKLYTAINKVAKNNGLDFIFDKSGDLLMLVSNSKYDRSDEVLEELGVVSTSSEKGSNLPPQ
ncbi:MAG: OmpH family outer membrane protein [Bacteroidia bacterium]|jgi:outer membrane protein|nr:OmpH family outer membrane protein [Bacteroidia bacterium]